MLETSFETIQSDLENYPRFRKKPDFATVKALMDRLSYRDSIPLIHVVGTNGKGSVATMMTSILACHGLKVGTFTSPHLMDIRERMTVNGVMPEKKVFVHYHKSLSAAIKAHIDGGGLAPTFFELMFLLSLMYFNDEKVDVMVMEAGIGGRYDTTNVLENRWLNVITSIGLDHQDVLGPSLEAIVRDKAWIMRKEVLTLALVENDTVLEGLEGVSKEKEANFLSIGPFDGNILERGPRNIDFSLDTKYYNYERLSICANGDHQLTNAKLAIEAVYQLSDHVTVDPKKLVQGIADFYWPGRLEYIEPWLLLDGAHNIDGVKAFVAYMNTLGSSIKAEVVFACMDNKDYKDMCDAVLDIKQLKHIHLARLPYQRAVKAEVMAATFESLGFSQVSILDNIKEFLETKAKDIGDETLLCAIGSLYLVGAIKKYRGGLNNDQF